MATRSTYPPGVFCWVELATTEPRAAASFYAEVFGWAVDPPDPEDGYAYARLAGDPIAGVRPLVPATDGRPRPHWASFVAVDDVAALAAHAGTLGGEVSLPTAEDPSAGGRRALLRDPQGGALVLWQAQTWPGAARVNDPGCLCWNELGSPEPAQAAEFYSTLLGWDVARHDSEGQPYWTVRHDGAGGGINGGLRGLTPPEQQAQLPPHWLPYFTVAAIDETFARVAAAGGERVAGPVPLSIGRIGVLADRQQAAFAVFEGDVDD